MTDKEKGNDGKGAFLSHHDRPPPYDLSNFTILVVEDSAYMQSLMSSMLKVFGVGDIMVADSARQAIDLLKVTQARTISRHITKVDIVLTDWLMPKGSGKDLLKWVRTNEKDEVRFLPVVVVSAYTTEVITARARDLGANEVLVKPISASGLASRICTVIDHPRPFLEVPGYFGPDRRRQAMPYKGEDRRVMKPELIQVKNVTTE